MARTLPSASQPAGVFCISPSWPVRSATSPEATSIANRSWSVFCATRIAHSHRPSGAQLPAHPTPPSPVGPPTPRDMPCRLVQDQPLLLALCVDHGEVDVSLVASVCA